MAIKNQFGQALIELTLVCFVFASILLVIQAMIDQKRINANKYKISTEIKNEFRYKNKNKITELGERQ